MKTTRLKQFLHPGLIPPHQPCTWWGISLLPASAASSEHGNDLPATSVSQYCGEDLEEFCDGVLNQTQKSDTMQNTIYGIHSVAGLT